MQRKKTLSCLSSLLGYFDVTHAQILLVKKITCEGVLVEGVSVGRNMNYAITKSNKYEKSL